MSVTLRGGECLLRLKARGTEPYLLIEGIRVSGWKISQEAVDVTNLADGSWQRLLSGAGQRSLEIRIQGLYFGSAGEVLMRDSAFSASAIECEVMLDQVAAVRGPFVVAELGLDTVVNEEATYAATLRSAGPLTLN